MGNLKCWSLAIKDVHYPISLILSWDKYPCIEEKVNKWTILSTFKHCLYVYLYLLQ